MNIAEARAAATDQRSPAVMSSSEAIEEDNGVSIFSLASRKVPRTAREAEIQVERGILRWKRRMERKGTNFTFR